MYCGNCGTKIQNESASFCPQCGHPLGQSAAGGETYAPPGPAPAVETEKRDITKTPSRTALIVLGLAAILGLFFLPFLRVAWVSVQTGFDGRYSALGLYKAATGMLVASGMPGVASLRSFLKRSFVMAILTLIMQFVSLIITLVNKKGLGTPAIVASALSILFTVYYLIFGLAACSKIEWAKLSFLTVLYLVIVVAQCCFASRYKKAMKEEGT